MTELVRGPNGEYGVWSPNTGLQELSEQEYSQLKLEREAGNRGFVENSTRELGAQAQDAAGFFLDAIERPFRGTRSIEDIANGNSNTYGESLMRSNDAEQAARWKETPGAAVTGFVGSLAIPGGPVAKEAGLAGKVGTVGTKVGTTTTRGAARGVELAEGVINSHTARSVARTAMRSVESIPGVGPIARDAVDAGVTAIQRGNLNRKANQSLSAAAADPKRYRAGLMTPDELADFAGGFDVPLHPAQQGKLLATDAAQHTEAQNILRETELFERSAPGQLFQSNTDLMEQKNRVFMREIGADDSFFPDVDTLGDNLRRISNQFDQLKGTSEVDITGLVNRINKDIDQTKLLSSEAKAAVSKVTKWIEEMSYENGFTDVLSQDNASIISNRIQKNIREKLASQPDTEIVDVLSTIEQRLRARIQETFTPEQVALDKNLRRQWGLTMNALNRGASLGPTGLNIKSYLSSVGSKNRSVKTGRSEDPFIKYLRTVLELTGDKLPDSGTTQGIARMNQ